MTAAPAGVRHEPCNQGNSRAAGWCAPGTVAANLRARARERIATERSVSCNPLTPTSVTARQNGTMKSDYLLRLYVTGQTPRTEKAIANLRQICQDDLHGRYELQIIDVLKNPQLAEDEKILATPTLIKRLPPPLRRVIGDLSDKEKVLLGLDVWPEAPADSETEDQ